ncbi:MAG: lysophospholipid acyltransferase family protein [Planctomycetota bacterium]|jgi:lauroyl/myristoyl acyltransferase
MPAEIAQTSDAPSPNAAVAGTSRWQQAAFTASRAFCSAFAACFSLRGLYLFGQLFGTLEWLINYKRRRRFGRQMRQLLGESLTSRQRGQACRRFFMRSRCDKIFYLIFDKIPREQALSRLQVNGAELLDEVLQRGRGCFVAMSHHGTYHVGAMLMSLHGYRLVGVRDRHEGGIRRFVQTMYERRYPESQPLRVLYADSYPRDIYRCFQENYLVGAALDIQRDRGRPKRTVRINLLGQQREVMAATVQIALRCGAGVLQAFVISGKDFHYRLDLLGPLLSDANAPASEESLEPVMQLYADNIGRYLRKYPCHVSRL